MSFIYQNSLLNKFIKIGQDAALSSEDKKNAILSLVNSLKSENEASSNISFDGDPLFTGEALKSLGALLSFIASDIHPFKYNGHRIVYTETFPKQPEDEQIKNQYITIKPFSIYKEGFVAFLKDLQEKAKSSNDRYTQELVNSLIEQVNAHDQIKANIKDEKKQEPGKSTDKPKGEVSQLTDEQKQALELDRIPNIINLKQLDTPGNTPITALDLADINHFIDFLTKQGASIAISPDGIKSFPLFMKEVSPTMNIPPDKTRICWFLNYLYMRAGSQTDKNPNKKVYLDSLVNLSRVYECKLGFSGQEKQEETESITMPLSEGLINLRQIDKFATDLLSLIQSNQEPYASLSKSYAGTISNYHNELVSAISAYKFAVPSNNQSIIEQLPYDIKSVTKDTDFIQQFQSSRQAVKAAESLITIFDKVLQILLVIKDNDTTYKHFGTSRIDNQISLAQNFKYYLNSTKYLAMKNLQQLGLK